MVEYALLFDIRRCIGCYACEIACKQENDLPVGPRLIRVITIGPRMVGEKLSMDYVPVACIQCGKPDCMDVCPKKAITKRPDGIVVINEELCSGCKLCIQACPLGVMQFNSAKNVAVKCTMCPERIEKGLKPSCVQHCPAGAIHLGDVNESTEVKSRNHALAISSATKPVLAQSL